MLRLASIFKFLSFAAVATSAAAFPSNIRKGYQGCGACHVSPSGGALPTDYGRVASEEFMATWAMEGEGRSLYFLESDDINFGGDIRQTTYVLERYNNNTIRNFLMQADLELAARITPHVTVVGSAGVYGEAQVFESRRKYLMIKPNKYFSMRFGRFLAPFGLGIADHTAYIKRFNGLDQGRETVNLELHLESKYGEIFLTHINGSDGGIVLDRESTDLFTNDNTQGFALKAGAFLPGNFQLGITSLYRDYGNRKDMIGGLYGMAAWTKNLYTLAEFDIQFNDETNEIDRYLAFARTGYFIHRGVDIRGQYQLNSTADDSSHKISVGLQWIPRPHLELCFDFSMTFQETENIRSSVLVLHYWL